MQKKLARAIDAPMPRVNQTIAEGFHKKEFEDGLHYYERSLKLIFKSIERRGVIFKNVEKVSPREYIDYLRDSSSKLYDIHKETLYPVRLCFEYIDKAGIRNPMYAMTMLPYTDRYGDIFLRGVQYSLQFVLAERGLPVTKEGEIFVKVLGFKFKIRVEHFKYDQVMLDAGHYYTRAADINLSANRFYSPTDSRRITDSKTPTPLLAWYIFADMGFSKAMAQYGECDYEIGPIDALIQECKTQDRWEIFTRTSSTNEQRLGSFIPHDIGIAIRNKSAKRKELSLMGLQYACALLFVVDCMSSYFDLDRIDDPDYWKLLVGRTSVKPGDSNDYIMRLMYEHFDSVNEYLDEDSIKKFGSQSIVVSNMFDLFNHIIANRSEIVQTTDRSNMFHKELASLEFTLDRLITAANSFKHDIKNNSELSQKKVARFLANRFHIKEIDNARTTNLIQEATPTDNPYVDYMLGCMPQHKVYTSSTKAKKKGDFDPTDAAGLLSASLPFVNSYLRVTGPYPDGRGYLTPCVYLINEKFTGLHPRFKELFEKTDKRLRYRAPVVRSKGMIRPGKKTAVLKKESITDERNDSTNPSGDSIPS